MEMISKFKVWSEKKKRKGLKISKDLKKGSNSMQSFWLIVSLVETKTNRP